MYKYMETGGSCGGKEDEVVLSYLFSQWKKSRGHQLSVRSQVVMLEM